MAPRLFKPIGRCIYCGVADAKLTDEHIVPRGLWGDQFLPDASCEDHRVITGRIEGKVLRQTLWAARARMGYKSPHKDWPEEFPVQIRNRADTWQTTTAPPDEYPVAFVLPKFDPPGLLLGRERDEGFVVQPWLFATADLKEKYKQLGGKGILGPLLHIGTFAKMLAKIAHAAAVAECGYDGFVHLLPDIILSREPAMSHFVGSPFGPIAPAETMLHRIEFEKRRLDGRCYLVTEVRLFAKYGAPTYQIVTGELLGR